MFHEPINPQPNQIWHSADIYLFLRGARKKTALYSNILHSVTHASSETLNNAQSFYKCSKMNDLSQSTHLRFILIPDLWSDFLSSVKFLMMTNKQNDGLWLVQPCPGVASHWSISRECLSGEYVWLCDSFVNTALLLSLWVGLEFKCCLNHKVGPGQPRI